MSIDNRPVFAAFCRGCATCWQWHATAELMKWNVGETALYADSSPVLCPICGAEMVKAETRACELTDRGLRAVRRRRRA